MISIILVGSLLGFQPVPDVSEIIKKVKAKYAGLSSYKDAAKVTLTHPGGEDRQTFRTWFQRPGRWRLEFTEPRESGRPATLLFWCNGSSTRLWDDVYRGSPRVLASPQQGFEAVGRVGGSYCDTVPGLLDPGAIDDRTIDDVRGHSILPESMIGATKCIRVQGKGPGQATVTIWIDGGTSLIHRIENESRIQNLGSVRIIVDYFPVPNPKLAGSVFEFRAPSGGG